MGPADNDPKRRREEVGRRFETRYDQLRPEELAEGEDWSLDRPETALFLGTYSVHGITRVLETYGLSEMLAERGIERWHPEVDTSDPFLHVLRFRDEDCDEIICELRVRLGLGKDHGLPGRLAELTFFVIEWLSIENPRGTFDNEKPPLPGQRRPGLGIGPEVEEILVLSARRLGVSALLARPSWFHNAYLYHPRWRFVDPREEGRFVALLRDLGWMPLPRLSWAVHLGCVRDDGGNELRWDPGPLMLPRTREAERWLESPWYRAARFAAKARTGYRLDAAKLEAELSERGLELA